MVTAFGVSTALDLSPFTITSKLWFFTFVVALNMPKAHRVEERVASMKRC